MTTPPVPADLARLLDLYDVPPLPPGFADRVVARALARPRPASPWRRRLPVRWGRGVLALGSATLLAATAAAAGWLGERVHIPLISPLIDTLVGPAEPVTRRLPAPTIQPAPVAPDPHPSVPADAPPEPPVLLPPIAPEPVPTIATPLSLPPTPARAERMPRPVVPPPRIDRMQPVQPAARLPGQFDGPLPPRIDDRLARKPSARSTAERPAEMPVDRPDASAAPVVVRESAPSVSPPVASPESARPGNEVSDTRQPDPPDAIADLPPSPPRTMPPRRADPPPRGAQPRPSAPPPVRRNPATSPRRPAPR